MAPMEMVKMKSGHELSLELIWNNKESFVCAGPNNLR